MNNFDIKDNPNLINNQEDGLFETERISEFMDVLKDFNFAYKQLTQMSSSFSEDLKLKIMNSGSQINTILQKIKENYDRHSEKQNDYFKKYFINCEKKKSEILNVISNEINRIREIISSSEAKAAQSLYVMNYIYDDEFVTIINCLSSSIKEFFKSTRNSIGSIKKSSDSIVDQILGSKSSISDVFIQINSCLISKYSQSKANNAAALSKEKNIKEKLNQIVEKLESINEKSSNVGKNIKFLEQNFSEFYDQAKQIFKDMKKTRNQRLDELNNLGVFNQGAFNNIKNLNSQFNSYNNNMNFNISGNMQYKNINIKQNIEDDEYNSDGFNKITASPNPRLFNKNFNFNQENFEKNKNINITNTAFYNQDKKRLTSDDFYRNKGYSSTGFDENKIRASIEDLDKEERVINDRIDNLKKANSGLVVELKSLQQNYVNIKFENLCLKEKLDKFSNGNSNENQIGNINDNNIYFDKNNNIFNGKSTINPRSFRIQENTNNYTINHFSNQDIKQHNKTSSDDPTLKNIISKSNKGNFNPNPYDLENLNSNDISNNREQILANDKKLNSFENNNQNNINHKQWFEKERCNSHGNNKLLCKLNIVPNNYISNSNLNNRSINTSNNFYTVDNELPTSCKNSKENFMISNNNKINLRGINSNIQPNANFNSDLSHNENNGSEVNYNTNSLFDLNKILLRFKGSSEKVLEFLAQMSSLQENIQKKHPKINDLKIEFELKKKELHKISIENISFNKKLLENYKSLKSTIQLNNDFIEEENNQMFCDMNLNEKTINNSLSGNSKSNKKLENTKNFLLGNNSSDKNTSSTTRSWLKKNEKHTQNKSFNNNLIGNNKKSIVNTSSVSHTHVPKNPIKSKLSINIPNNQTETVSKETIENSNIKEEKFALVCSGNPYQSNQIKDITINSNTQNRKLSNQSFKSVKDLNCSIISDKSSEAIISNKIESEIIVVEKNPNQQVFTMNTENEENAKNKFEENECIMMSSLPMEIMEKIKNIPEPLIESDTNTNLVFSENFDNRNDIQSSNKDQIEKIAQLEKNILEYEKKFSLINKKLDDNSKELNLNQEVKSKLEANLKNIEDKLKEEKTKLKKLMEQVIQKDTEILKLINYKEEVDNLEKKIKSLEGQIEELNRKNLLQEKELKEKLDSGKKLLETENNRIAVEYEIKLTSLNKELNELKSYKDNIEKSLVELKEKLDKKEKEKEELDKIIFELNAQKESLKTNLEDLNKKISILDEEKSELVEKYNILEDEMFNQTSQLLASQSTNVEITKEISHVKSLNSKLQNELDILKNEKLDASVSIKKLNEKQQMDLQERESELKSQLNQNIELTEKIKILNIDIISLKEIQDKLSSEYEERLKNVNSVLEASNKRQEESIKRVQTVLLINENSEAKEKDYIMEKIIDKITHLKEENNKLSDKHQKELNLISSVVEIITVSLQRTFDESKDDLNNLLTHCDKEKMNFNKINLSFFIEKIKSLNNNFIEDENSFDSLKELLKEILVNKSDLYKLSSSLLNNLKNIEKEIESNLFNFQSLEEEHKKALLENNDLKNKCKEMFEGFEKIKHELENDSFESKNKIIELSKNIEDNKIEIETLSNNKRSDEKKIESLHVEIKDFINKFELKEKEIEINNVKSSNKLKELECLIDDKENENNKKNLLIEEMKQNYHKISIDNSLLKNKLNSLLENKISLEELSELGTSGENKLKNILIDYDKKIIEITELKNDIENLQKNNKILLEEKSFNEKQLEKEKSNLQKTKDEKYLLEENLEMRLIELKEANAIIIDNKSNEENLNNKITKLNELLKEKDQSLNDLQSDNFNRINEITNLKDLIEKLNKSIEEKNLHCTNSDKENFEKITCLEKKIQGLDISIKEKQNLINLNYKAIKDLKDEIISKENDNNKINLVFKEKVQKLENTIEELKITIKNNDILIIEKVKFLEIKEEELLKLENEKRDNLIQIKDLLAKTDHLKESHNEEIKILNEKHADYLKRVKEEIIKSQKGESDVLKNYYENEIKNITIKFEDKILKLQSDIDISEKNANELNKENNKFKNEIKILELKLQKQENHLDIISSKANELEIDLEQKITLVKTFENTISDNNSVILNLEKKIKESVINFNEKLTELNEIKKELNNRNDEISNLKITNEKLNITTTDKGKINDELEKDLNKYREFESLFRKEAKNNEKLQEEMKKLIQENNLIVNSLKEDNCLKSRKEKEILIEYENNTKMKDMEILNLKNKNKETSDSLSELNIKYLEEKELSLKSLKEITEKIIKSEENLIEVRINKEKEIELLNKNHKDELDKLGHNNKLEVASTIENYEQKMNLLKLENSEQILKYNNLLKEYDNLIRMHEENMNRMQLNFANCEQEKIQFLKTNLEANKEKELNQMKLEMENKIKLQREEFELKKKVDMEKLHKDYNNINTAKKEELEKVVQEKNKEIKDEAEKISDLLKKIEDLKEEKEKLIESLNNRENEIYLENEKVIQLEQLLESEKQITGILTDVKIPTIESEKTNLKDQLSDLDKLYKHENKNHSEAIKQKDKEISEKQTKIEDLNFELSKIKENQLKNNQEISRENNELNMKIIESNKKIESDKIELENYRKEQDEIKLENKDLKNKVEAYNNEIEILKKKTDEMKQENKELKNKIAKLKIEFDEINNNQINEVKAHKKSTDLLNTEFDKINKEICKLLFKLQVFEDNKNFSKIKKNFDSDIHIISQMKNDSLDISNTNNNSHNSISKKIDSLNLDTDLQQINELVENKHKKIAELIKRNSDLEEEKKLIEKSLNDLNNLAESKIKDYTEENKRLKHVNDEYNKKILEAVNTKAPHLINSLEINSNTINKNTNEDFMKTLDLFKKFNEELNDINKEFEEKFLKATEKVKKYKKLYREVLSIKTNSNVNVLADGVKNANEIDPNNYRIIIDKEINGLKWFAITYKDISDYEINHQNTYWVASSLIEDKLDLFNKFISEAEKVKEMNNLYIVQEELLKKLATKEEELIKIRNERDNLIKKQKLIQNYDVNNPIYENTIPLEKYQVLLNNLIEEQEKFRTAVFQIEKLRLENESLKNIVEHSIPLKPIFKHIKNLSY